MALRRRQVEQQLLQVDVADHQWNGFREMLGVLLIVVAVHASGGALICHHFRTRRAIIAYDAATGTLTLVGTLSAPEWESVLRAVTFSSSSEDPTGTQSASEREVAFVISDGDADSNMATRTISVMPVNDAPVLSAVEHSSLVYVENQAALFVSDALVVSEAALYAARQPSDAMRVDSRASSR